MERVPREEPENSINKNDHASTSTTNNTTKSRRNVETDKRVIPPQTPPCSQRTIIQSPEAQRRRQAPFNENPTLDQSKQYTISAKRKEPEYTVPQLPF